VRHNLSTKEAREHISRKELNNYIQRSLFHQLDPNVLLPNPSILLHCLIKKESRVTIVVRKFATNIVILCSIKYLNFLLDSPLIEYTYNLYAMLRKK